jgi:hypothetical protein
MADAITGNTELGSTKQDLIAALVQKELAFNAVLTRWFTDLSSLALPGSKSVSIPKLSSFTVIDRAEGVAGDATALTATVDQLLLDKAAYVSWIIDSVTAIQSNIPAQLEFARRAAAAQSRYVDSQIIAELRTVAKSFVNVGADVNITYANTVDMVQALEESNADMSQAVWLVSPQQKGALMKLDEFKRADVYGSANIPRGLVGEIHGVPVVMHNGLAGKEAFLCEKSGLAFAFQKGAQYGEQPEIAYGVGAMKAAIDQLFGIKGMQIAQAGAAAGKSPFVLGLND